MAASDSTSRKGRWSIAIHALGGEGGGVLAQWITALGDRGGFHTQATSVPGVAQRTGATIYYVEMAVRSPGAPEPFLCLMPVPGDVDVVLASELAEAGRAILRGFVSQDRTVLVASTHRVFSIGEKSARGNGAIDSEVVLAASRRRAKRFVNFDMSAAARESGSPISAVMFGALAGAEVLPLPVAAFREVIRSGDKASDANLAGFEAGVAGARMHRSEPVVVMSRITPTTEAGRVLAKRAALQLPAEVQDVVTEGLRRLMEYQDFAYASLYLDRLVSIAQVDDGSVSWLLTREVARHLALWMSYEDTIRVADLKTRAARLEQVRSDLKVSPQQIVVITDYMHPRLQEVCDTLPGAIGDWLLNSRWAARLVSRFFQRGRRVASFNVPGFLLLSALAALRRFRPHTRRFRQEQARIVEWLGLITQTAPRDIEAAIELARCQRVIKGYGETLERGLSTFETLIASYRAESSHPHAASLLRAAREQALVGTAP